MPDFTTFEDNRCHYCALRFFGSGSRDHIVPVALGGRDARINIVQSCRPCNTRKGHALLINHCNTCTKAQLDHLAYIDTLEPHITAARRERWDLAARITVLDLWDAPKSLTLKMARGGLT